MDPVTLGMAKSAVNKRIGTPAAATPPSGLGWPAGYALTASLTDLVPGSPRSLGACSLNPEDVFNAKSTALTAPGATFYVAVGTGNDTNAGTIGAPVKSIWKAIVLANTAAVPSKIIVDASTGANTYFRTNNPWYNGGSGVSPTVDIALLASGGRVITGTFDPPGTPTLDATFTNCYSWAVSSVDKIADIRNSNRFGNYNELTQVGTAALCNAIPDSWALVTGTLYVNRRDRQAVTNANTRVYRGATGCVVLSNAVNVYIGGVAGNDGFDFEGSNDIGCLAAYTSTPGTTHKALVINNCSFKYAGGSVNTDAKGVAVNSRQGITFLSNCRADANQTDGFNFHNTYAATVFAAITLNCTGFDNGRPLFGASGSYSNNGWTSHEDVKGIDIAGHYEESRGGAMHNIDTSKTWAFGTLIVNDRGDLAHGGTIPPNAFRAANSATIWCERVKTVMPAGGFTYLTLHSTAAIHKRDCWRAPQPDNPGAGTIDTY